MNTIKRGMKKQFQQKTIGYATKNYMLRIFLLRARSENLLDLWFLDGLEIR